MWEKPGDEKTELSGDAAIEKVRTLLPQFRSAMFITAGSDGGLHARPLALQGDVSKFGGVLWFFVDERSRKVQESSGGADVSLVCQSDEHSAYLQLTGLASVVRDLPKMREMYSPIIKTWFPEGLDDPNLTLLKFEALSGAYWESPGGVLQLLGGFAKAVVTGIPGKGGNAGSLRL